MSTPNPFDELFYGSAESEQDELLEPEATAPQPPDSPPEQPDRNPFDDLFYGAPEPEPVAAPPEEMGTFENLWAGLKERGASLIGDLAGGVQTIGQRAEEEWLPSAGGIVHHGGLDFDYLTPEEWAKYTQDGGRMGLLEIQEDWKNASYGFTSNSAENWEKLKGDAGLWEKTQAAAAFALETGVISLADMAGAVVAPPAYIVARTEEIAQERAINAGRAGRPSNDDLKIAFGTAVIIQAMERFGFDRIADAFTKGGSALQRILTAGLAEGATEAVQEPLEFLAETYATPVEEGMTTGEYALAAGERSAQGALGGGPTGAVLATPSILLGTEEGPISDEVKDLDENRHAVTRALNEQAMRMEQEGVIQDQREQLESEQQQAELEVQRAADEIDAQEKTYKSAAHAEIALQKLEQKYGITSLFPTQMGDGEWILEPYGMHTARQVMAERKERLGGLGQRPAETGQIEVTEGQEIDVDQPAPTTEGIQVGEEIIATEPAPSSEGIEVTEQPLDLYIDPTRAPIGVRTVPAEEVVATEPAPTAEGIEVEEIQTQELDEGIPQIGVQEVTEGEEEITVGRKIYHRKPKKPPTEEPPDDEGPGGPPGGPPVGSARAAAERDITTQIFSGAIAKGRKQRKGIDDEIAQVEADLAKIPSNINIDEQGADVLMDQAHKLRIQRRDLLDEQRYRVTPEEAKQARKEMWEKMREAGERINRYESLEEMRKRLGDKAVDSVRDGTYRRVVEQIAAAAEEGITPTVEYLQKMLGLSPLAAKKNLDRYNAEVAEPTEPKELRERPGLFDAAEVGDGTNAFLDEMPGELKEDTYTYEGAEIDLEPDGENQIRVANIEALERGKGAGSRAMNEIIRLADKHGVDLSLEPVAFAIQREGDPATEEVMSQEDLESWYRRLGFEFDPEFENTMIRPAGGRPAPEEDLTVPGRLDTDVLPDGSTYDLSKSAETQIATTVGTYDKVKERYFSEVDNGDILDYGAGKGLASQKYGFESLEPYPRGWSPDYQNTYKIRRQYDGVILNNILNVLPKHTRRAVLFDAAEKLRDGGQMYINVRSRADVMKTTKIEKRFNDSEILTSRGTYQKGFQPAELLNFVRDELGPSYIVEKGEFGSVSIIVTKRTAAEMEAETETREAAEAAAGLELEGREPTDTEAQIAAFNFVDSNPVFVGLRLSHGPGDKRYGKTLVHYYGDQDATEGADKDRVDVMLSKDFEIGTEYPIYIANLTDLETSDFEQHKVLAGFDTAADAQQGVESMYPGQSEPVIEIPADEYPAWVKSARTRVPFDLEQFRGALQRGEDLAKPTETDTTWDPAELAVSETDAVDLSPWLLADGSIVDGGADHMGYVISRGIYAEDGHDLRAVSAMQLEGGGVRSAFFYDKPENTAVAWLHVHDDQALTEEQIATVEKFAQAARKAGRKVNILIGATPTYDPENAPTEFNPVMKKSSISGLKRDYGKRKRMYRAQMERFYAGLAERSARFARIAVGRLRGQLKPDPTQDDLITFLRKHGGLNVNLGGDWRGRLSHLNKEYRLPGLPGIEQTDGTGLSLDQAAEIAFESDYIPEYDADLLADLLSEAESGRQLYSDQNQTWMKEEWEAQQAEAIDRMADETAAEMQDWAAELDGYDAVDSDMSDLMAEASLIDEGEVERIVSNPDLSDDAVKEQLRNLIDERKQATEPESVEAAEEAVEADAGVEAEAPRPEGGTEVSDGVRKPEQAPDVRDYERVEDYPWQELAAFADVEILEPPKPDFEGPRMFVIDVYSDVERTKFVKQVFAANYFRYRDVETAFLARKGPFRARIQDRDEFIQISKMGFVSAKEPANLHQHILKGNLKKPYRKLKSIERIKADETSDKNIRPMEGSGWLAPGEWSGTAAGYIEDLMAEPDPELVVKHWGEEFKKGKTKRNYISHKEGRAKIAEWEAHAKEVGRKSRSGELASRNSQRVILSLFDATGEWAQPWIDAGYDVRAIDLKRDDMDIMDIDYQWLENMGFLEGPGIWGILAACPCTTFTGTAAQDWGYTGTPRPLNEGGMDFIGKTHSSVDLVNQTLSLIDFLKPRFWALENPVGRVKDITGVPEPRLSFNPNNYGDPYTKKTQIFGNFNANLPTANVDPRKEHGGLGSKMHRLGSKDELDGGLRSVTPKGFAYAFFMANNDADYPIVQEIADQAKRTLHPDVKANDPNIERKVELLVQLTLSQGAYPTDMDQKDGTVSRYDDAYSLKETDNFPEWAQLLMEEMQYDIEEDWRLGDGAILSRRELNHMDQELRSLLNVGQKKTTDYPQKTPIDSETAMVSNLNELGEPYADEDFSIIDPYMEEAAVEAVNTALEDLAAQGYTYADLRGKPLGSMPDYLADPLGVIIEVASGAIPVAKALRAVQKGDKRTKPETAFNRIANWNEKLEEAVGQQALSHEEFKQHIYEEYPWLAKALDEIHGDDDGMAMRRQRPDPVTVKAELYESLGRDDLAWAPVPEPMMPAETGPPPPVPQRPDTEVADNWEVVPERERPPEVDINGVLEASTQGEGTALPNIPLSTQVGDRTITHNAKWFKDAIDSRLERLNKLRGCA